MKNSILSIILVTKDNTDELQETLFSLKGFENAEIIVVNGSSQKLRNTIIEMAPHQKIKILEGPDTGIYDGMNRGISAANGKFIWFLNSGDQSLVSDHAEMLTYFLDRSKADLIIGLQNPSLAFPILAMHLSKYLLFAGLRPIPHQSTFIDRRLLLEMGGYDLAHPISADQKMFLKLYSRGMKPHFFASPISLRKPGGIGDLQIKGSFKLQIKQFVLEDAILMSRGEQAVIRFLKVHYSILRGIYNLFRLKVR